MASRRIVLLGAGSYYFHTVLGELGATPELAGSEVVLFDVNKRRMEMTYGLGKRLLAKAGKGSTIRKARSLGQAVDGADYVITSIGVHRPTDKQTEVAEWHHLDVAACARLGVIHTTGDTVGPAGISQGLRIIPIFLDIAAAMTKYCPDAVLLNHSNPMGAICRAISKYSSIHAIGYCHNVYGDLRRISRLLGVPREELDCTAAGINHMGWFLDIRRGDKDLYPRLKRKVRALRGAAQVTEYLGEGGGFVKDVVELFDLYPVGGGRHTIEFFPHARINEKRKDLAYGLRWRGERIKQGKLKLELRNKETAARISGAKEVTLPQPHQLSPESMGQQIKSMAFGPERLQFVSVPNRGAVTNLPDWAVVEVKSRIGPGGAVPIHAGTLPAQAARWTAAQVYASELTIEAAAEGSRQKALQALACDPMVRDFREAEKILDALVRAQGERLKRFRKRARRVK